MRKTWTIRTLVAALGLLTACTGLLTAQGNEDIVPANWQNVAIGGGGYVTGLIFHPTAPGVIYAHTDVGGAYRWDQSARRWVQLLNWLTPAHANWQGVESIAVDPQDATGQIVYAAVGEYAIDWATPPHGDVLKSMDGGRTWKSTHLGAGFASPLVDFKGVGIGSNWTQGYRERLMVDPNAPNILLYGSAGFGLWRSVNAGASWTRAANAPTGTTANIGQWGGASGIVFVAVDPTSSNGRSGSSIWYLGVPGASTDAFAGIWQTRDAGAHWSLLPGGPLQPQQGTVGPDGAFYVTHATGVMKWAGNHWTDVTPQGIQQTYGSIAVDPHDPKRLLCNGFWWGFDNPLYMSNDGGASWSTVSTNGKSNVPWWPDSFAAAAISSVAFDPFRRDHAAYSDWYGVWETGDIGNPAPIWRTHEQGHEETVTLALAAAPQGAPLFSGSADVGGFRHDSLGRFPDTSFGLDLGLSDITGIDFSEGEPSFVVTAGGNRSVSQPGSLGYSTDGGRTWTAFNNTGAIGTAGRIAVSATTRQIVWLPFDDMPWVSTDVGKTWRHSTGAPSGTLTGNAPFVYSQPLATDRVDGKVAYLYDGVSDGGFYRSHDGGLTWARTKAALPTNYGGQFQLLAAPSMRGEVWVSIGGYGLYESKDGGDTFSQVAAVANSEFFSFGIGRNHRSAPAVFVLGTIAGKRGVYISEDLGVSWRRMETQGHGFSQVTAMQGDRQVFGRVYLGTNGTGIFVGSPQEDGH